MAPLRSLEREYPVIDSNFRQFCASHGIFSVEDLLIHDVCALISSTEQHSNSERLKQGITQVLSVIDLQHQPWLNGMELFQDAQQNKHAISTGCEKIDMLLQGGLHEGHLIELVGPSSSGKTQVCLHATSNVAMNHTGGVVFVDTGNSFSSKRIVHFISQILDHADKQARYKNLKKIMTRISCHSVFDLFTLLDVLHQLNSNLRCQRQAGSQVRLLIIDSISSLITPILGGRDSHGRALMILVGYLLKKLAHEHNLCVLVTNHMVAGEGGMTKPALGDSWRGLPHVRLQLLRDHRSKICEMSILRHPYLASGNAVKFMVP